MKKAKKIVWGILLVVLGVIWGLNALEVTDIDIFFDGWWTLLIIVPSIINLFTKPGKVGSLINIAAGVVLLLACQDILKFDLLWKLALPILLVVIGIKIIFADSYKQQFKEIEEKMRAKGINGRDYCAVFSGQEIDMTGKKFEGANMVAIFGGIDCNLSQAHIDEDVMIHTVNVFGGTDLILPSNVNLKVSSVSIFGGVEDKRTLKSADNAVTVYVKAVCILGGTDIK